MFHIHNRLIPIPEIAIIALIALSISIGINLLFMPAIVARTEKRTFQKLKQSDSVLKMQTTKLSKSAKLDLIETILDYLPNNRNIIHFKNTKNNLKVSVKITKDYYTSLGIDYNKIYCYCWKIHDNNVFSLRPDQNIVKTYQLLPYLFDHENHFDSCGGNCDYCSYKIDYPRVIYLINNLNNNHKGKHSNFYNNWINKH